LQSGTQSTHIVAAAVGFTSFFMIWLSVIWGLILKNGWMSTRMRHSTIHGAHMVVALMGLTLGCVHAAAQLAVPFAVVHLVDVVVPFTNPTDQVGIGIAVVGLEIMIAAAISVAVQHKMGYNRWRALHALNHVAFALIVAHILISGSDVAGRAVWGTVLLMWVAAIILWASTARQASQAGRAVGAKVGVTPRRDKAVVQVDSSKCARYGFCEHEAPDVFTLLGDGRLSYRVSVNSDQVNDVVRAMEVCPRRAIYLNRPPTAVVNGRRPEPVEDDAHLTSPRGLPTANITQLHKRGAPQ
jgi:ferredoxin